MNDKLAKRTASSNSTKLPTPTKPTKPQKEHSRISWDTLKPKPISWLHEPYLPLGKISILVGDSGLGKTTLAIDIAARLTTGRPMPLTEQNEASGGQPLKSAVIFQSNEDDLEDTLLPRCIAAGADLTKFITIEASNLNIDEDCHIFEQHIQETGTLLCILDPVQSFFGRNADMCRITDVRRLLTNLGTMAARNNCAVILIAHNNKSTGGKDLHRVFGSVDLTATARSVLRVSASEDDPDVRIVSHIKSSVAKPGAPIAFRIGSSGAIEYLDYHDICFGDSLANGEDFDDSAYEAPDETTKIDKAIQIIYAMLSEGPQEGKLVFRACGEAGTGIRTVEKAKKVLNVQSVREGKKYLWTLS